eukprot:3647653-Rhodomonas_salina.3
MPIQTWVLTLGAWCCQVPSTRSAPLSAYALSYAMPGTDKAYRGIGWAIRGTDIAYGLRARYAVPGTEVVYAATTQGAFATIGSTFVGHYPWFATFNALQVDPMT